MQDEQFIDYHTYCRYIKPKKAMQDEEFIDYHTYCRYKKPKKARQDEQLSIGDITIYSTEGHAVAQLVDHNYLFKT